MSEKRCDLCKFWIEKGSRDTLANHPDFGDCDKAKPYWDATEWSKDGEFDPTNPTRGMRLSLNSDDKMFVQDGSDNMAVLITRRDFYCAHFEAKP